MKKKIFIVFVLFFCLGIVNVYAAPSGDCNGLTPLVDFMRNNVYTPVKIAAPVLFVVLTTLDFAGVVLNNGKDGMEKAKKKFINRAIACVIIFFIPYILDLVLTLLNDSAIKSCLNRMN